MCLAPAIALKLLHYCYSDWIYVKTISCDIRTGFVLATTQYHAHKVH